MKIHIRKTVKTKAKKDRVLTVKFNADIAATMRWNFRPQQSEVRLYAGETALAFYTAKNPTEKPIDGISTYNVVPFEAGQVSLFYNIQYSQGPNHCSKVAFSRRPDRCYDVARP